MTNSQTVPATAVKANVGKSAPFARARAMMAAIAQAMQLTGMMKQMAMESIGPYQSRGKGKGKPARRAIKPRRHSYNHYDFSSTRQHDRHAATQHTVIVNGFPLMQTRPARDRYPVLAKAA